MSDLDMPEQFRNAAQHINDATGPDAQPFGGKEFSDLVAHWLDIAAEQWEQDPLQIDAEECDEIYHPAIAIARLVNGGAS